MKQGTRPVEDHFIECYPSSCSLGEMERRYIKIYKCVNDVAGYHCKAWKCVMNNKGLQKPLIFKKAGWNTQHMALSSQVITL